MNTPKEKRAQRTIEEIQKLMIKLNEIAGLPTKLKNVKIEKEDFEKVAKIAMNDGAIIVNPKAVEEKDIIQILEKAY